MRLYNKFTVIVVLLNVSSGGIPLLGESADPKKKNSDNIDGSWLSKQQLVYWFLSNFFDPDCDELARWVRSLNYLSLSVCVLITCIFSIIESYFMYTYYPTLIIIK